MTEPCRRRYRCAHCFTEDLLTDSQHERHPDHIRYRRLPTGELDAVHCGNWEPVARRRPRKKTTA